MKFKKTLPLIIVGLSLSSCGYGLKEYYDNSAYATGNFQLDCYKVWNKKIDKNYSKNSLIGEEEVHELTREHDFVFTSYYDGEKYLDQNFRLCDRGASENLSYHVDYMDNQDAYDGIAYGSTRRLSKIENSFKYGYLSKLFDGSMFCYGRYQAARVQIGESGFGALFNKEGDNFDYFAINFKAAYDYTRSGTLDFNKDGVISPQENTTPTNTAVKFKVTFYEKENNGYHPVSFTYRIEDIPTNGNEGQIPYKFFGFRLNTYNLTRVAGFSITYEFDRENDDVYKGIKDKDGNKTVLDYNLLLYEVLLPNTTWR